MVLDSRKLTAATKLAFGFDRFCAVQWFDAHYRDDDSDSNAYDFGRGDAIRLNPALTALRRCETDAFSPLVMSTIPAANCQAK